MSGPLIFLDVDGVLVTFDSMRAATGPRDRFVRECADRKCIEVLNSLTDRTGAHIVVSSSWRHGRSVEQLRELLRAWGVTGHVRDKTREDSELLTEADIAAGRPYLGDARGDQIADWLRENDHRGPFVILDDDTDMRDLMPRLVKTSMKGGLRSEHADRAIAILSAAPTNPQPQERT